MASDGLDIPQIAVVGVPEDNNHATPTQPHPSPPSDGPHVPPPPLGHATSSTDNQGFLSLKLLASPPPHHRLTTVASVGSSSTEREYENNQSFRLSPVRSAHSDATSTPPSPMHTHVDVVPDIPSPPSSRASFIRKTLHRVRRSSPSPSGEMDTGSDMTQNDGPKGDNSDLKCKRRELARPAVLDLKQEAHMDVHPFAFKPLQLASLVDPKSLGTLESMGGVDAILRGLGTQPTYGLSTKLGPPPSHAGSHYPTFQDFRQFMRLAHSDKVLVR